MMDQGLKTHKEDVFGWLLAVRWLAAALRERGAGRAVVTAPAAGVKAPTIRYLAPR